MLSYLCLGIDMFKTSYTILNVFICLFALYVLYWNVFAYIFPFRPFSFLLFDKNTQSAKIHYLKLFALKLNKQKWFWMHVYLNCFLVNRACYRERSFPVYFKCCRKNRNPLNHEETHWISVCTNEYKLSQWIQNIFNYCSLNVMFKLCWYQHTNSWADDAS